MQIKNMHYNLTFTSNPPIPQTTPSAAPIPTPVQDENPKISESIDRALKQVKKNTPDRKDGAFVNWVCRMTAKLANAKWFEKMANKPGKTIAVFLVIGNIFKEIGTCSIYTVQGLTNETLPPDKRKFIGMFDLGIGALSATLGGAMGLVTAFYQDKIGEFLIGGNKMKAKKLPGFSYAASGLAILVPLVLQQIVTKRIIAPAISTPLAGHLKRKLEAKEAARNGGKVQDDPMFPGPQDTLILAEQKQTKNKNTK